MSSISEILGPQAVAQLINRNDLVRRVASALGIDTRTLILSEQDTQNIQDQESADQLTNTVAPQLAGQLGQALAAPQGDVPPTEGL